MLLSFHTLIMLVVFGPIVLQTIKIIFKFSTIDLLEQFSLQT